jgi:WD40 repeat protein/serine/threonine protein kinase
VEGDTVPVDPERVQAVFLAAAEQEGAAGRAAVLDRLCGADAGLRQRVETLLRAHEAPGPFLESPAPNLVATADEVPVTERPGTMIGPYKLLEQIGEGGFGVVFLAEQQRPVRRKVALKILKPGMDTRQVITRFEAERQALALMDHPHIARIHDGGTTADGRPFFAMELVKGIPITDYCDQCGLTTRERLGLFLSVCQAVQHAHQKGVIHRDIKPSNVLVAIPDGQPAVKVIDFGVAKAINQRLSEHTLQTGFHQMIGTPLYMSPEQAEMSPLDVDTRADIYALGVLLYELLTGTTPFEKERLSKASYDEIRRIIREEEPPRPSARLSTLQDKLTAVAAQRRTEPWQLLHTVKGELDWIVMKCLEKDRNRRYETASAFAADVQRYLQDEPVEACPPSAGYRFRKFARRNKRGLLTASVVAVAVVLTAAGSGVLIWRANQDLHQALESEWRGGYSQRIALAEREWAGNNLGRMEQLLDECPEDLRGWEWRYLKRLRYGAVPPLRHESGVYCVAFSPDGQYLATAAGDGVVRLCRATSGQELRKWRAHAENATCVQFSPDSRYLASGGWDRTVKVWDVHKVLQAEIPAPLLRIEHTDPVVRVWSVSFSPDGQRLASAAGREAEEKGELKVWDMTTGEELLKLGSLTRALRCVQFSPDGRRLATCGQDLAQVRDAQTGRVQLTWRDPHRSFEKVAFSADGRRLTSVGGLFAVHPDREVKVWDAQTGQEVLSLRGHVGALRGVAFSPDGRRIASSGLDQTIKLWDTATGQEVLTLRGHIDNVFCVTFSPDGHRLASAGMDRTVRIWDASPVEGEPGPEYLTLHGHAGAVTDVAFHPTDGRTLASAGTDGTVRVWDFWSGKPLGTLTGTPSPIRLRLAYSPDEQRLAVVSGDRKDVRVWDVASAKEVGPFPGHGTNLLCVAFSPDGRHVASAGMNDFVVWVWDATTGQEVQALQGHKWPVHGVAFSPDGRHLASCSADTTVRVWDRTTGREPFVLEPPHAARVYGVAFSRDGELLASASWDRTIKVWETRTWRLVHDLPDPAGAVQCVAFGNDRRRLAWGSTDGTVKVWDAPGTQTHVLRGHTSWVQAVAFSPDGKWIASASLDGTVKIWQAPPEPTAPAPEAGKEGGFQNPPTK